MMPSLSIGAVARASVLPASFSSVERTSSASIVVMAKDASADDGLARSFAIGAAANRNTSGNIAMRTAI